MAPSLYPRRSTARRRVQSYSPHEELFRAGAPRKFQGHSNSGDQLRTDLLLIVLDPPSSGSLTDAPEHLPCSSCHSLSGSSISSPISSSRFAGGDKEPGLGMSSQIRVPDAAQIARAEAVLNIALALDHSVVSHMRLGNSKKANNKARNLEF